MSENITRTSTGVWWAGPLSMLVCTAVAAVIATALSVAYWPPGTLVAASYLFMVAGIGLFIGAQVGRATYRVIGHGE